MDQQPFHHHQRYMAALANQIVLLRLFAYACLYNDGCPTARSSQRQWHRHWVLPEVPPPPYNWDAWSPWPSIATTVGMIIIKKPRYRSCPSQLALYLNSP